MLPIERFLFFSNFFLHFIYIKYNCADQLNGFMNKVQTIKCGKQLVTGFIAGHMFSPMTVKKGLHLVSIITQCTTGCSNVPIFLFLSL